MTDPSVNALFRPPRTHYSEKSIALNFDSGAVTRCPISISNKRNQTMNVSIYYKTNSLNRARGKPCVLYLHSATSSQSEGRFLVSTVCKFDAVVTTFDFVGCGQSDGDYISMGYYEEEDVNFLLKYLHRVFEIGPFVLWGRGLGAVVALITKNHLISGIISDSAYSSLEDFLLAIRSQTKAPDSFVNMCINYLKTQIIGDPNYNLKNISPIDQIADSTIPVIFGHSRNDRFISFSNTQLLFDKYPGQCKQLMSFDVSHAGIRPSEWIKHCISFILDLFHIPQSYFQVDPSLQVDIIYNTFGELVNAAPPVEHSTNHVIVESDAEIKFADELPDTLDLLTLDDIGGTATDLEAIERAHPE